MTTTDILTALIGLYFLAAGTGLLRDRAGALRMIADLKTQPVVGYLAGLFTFVLGGALVAVHNDWSTLQSGFVSLIGWAALIEGVLLLSFRDKFLSAFDGMFSSDSVLKTMALVVMALGAVLLFVALT